MLNPAGAFSLRLRIEDDMMTAWRHIRLLLTNLMSRIGASVAGMGRAWDELS